MRTPAEARAEEPSGRGDESEPFVGDREGSKVAFARRRRWYRAVAVVVVPVLALACLEVVLRWGGVGYATRFFVRHPACPPGMVVENQRFPWRFFPRELARYPDPILISERKPAGTCRIFVLGESAAEGDPAPAFSFARILEQLLRARYPGTRFEVVNVSFTAISSHVILTIARDCARLQGDFWLIYMGNNEVIGPYGAGTVFSQPTLSLPLIRAGLALRQTRLGQCADALSALWRTAGDVTNGWSGLTMFAEMRMAASDPRVAAVNQHFARNLEDILKAGTEAGAQVLLSTMVGNLRDCPPFASLHGEGMTPEKLEVWEQAFRAGGEAEREGDWHRASREYARAAELDGGHAELHFRWGRSALALGQPAEAKTHFEMARDLDALRFRTDRQLNQRIRDAARQWSGHGVTLVDSEGEFGVRTADGIPGEEWFYEHVHFKFPGNYLLARIFVEAMEPLLRERGVEKAPVGSAWLTEAECAERLAYTQNSQFDILRIIQLRLEEPVYQAQLDQAQRMQRIQEQLAALRGENKPAARQRAVQLCRQALARNPDDWILRSQLARALGAADDAAGAAAEWEQVAKGVPHTAGPWFELAQLAQQQGRWTQSIPYALRALALNPDHARSQEALGVAYAETGQVDEAIRYLRAAIRSDPTRTQAAEYLARLRSGPKT